jgi:plasmid stability protein
MPSVTLKNIPPDLLDRLRKRAAGERRSLNQEVIHLLQQVLDAVEESGLLKEIAERQVKAWRQIAGRWRSRESAAQEIRRIYSARTRGRDVEL